MSNKQPTIRRIPRFPSRLVTASAGILALMLLAVPSALASSEQVGTFGGVLAPPIPAENFPEDAQMGGAMGAAINVNGSGGVPPGTVYVASVGGTSHEEGLKVDRYSPTGTFELAWTESGVRCGPAVVATPCPSRAQGTERAKAGIGIDQTTGDVYAYDERFGPGGEDEIHVYNAAGTELITEFGPKAPNGVSIAANPNQLHNGYGTPDPIAVDPNGRVYVYDAEASPPFDFRLMIFEPETPGHYEHYVYVGNSTGVPSRLSGVGAPVAPEPGRPVLSNAGNLYTAGEDVVEEYDPRAATPTLLCSLRVKDGGARGMTVNPETGDVYYYDYKNREVHRLSGQCGADGHFSELESFPLHPPRGFLEAMAVNPTLAWETGGPPGVLYVAAPGGAGETGGGEPGAGGLGYIFAPAASHTPLIESESVSNVRSTSASLAAVINPKGAATTYVFEYLTNAAYQANEPSERFAGAIRVPINGGSIGGSAPATVVSMAASGLSPSTEYVFRVVATSTGGSTEGAVQSFSTFPSEAPGLPDGRMYELVSPIDKHGGEVLPLNPSISSCNGCKPGETATPFPVASAPDGEALVYEGYPFTLEGGAIENEYMSKRTPSGWATTDLSPSTEVSGGGDGFKALDTTLKRAVIYQGPPSLAPGAPANFPNLYAQNTDEPAVLTPALTEPPRNRPPGTGLDLRYVGASADLSKVFFEANDALTGETPFAPPAVDGGTSKSNLYEWANGKLQLVNVAPGNGTTAPGGGVGPGHGSFEARHGLTHAISEDGSHVFWSSEAGQVYVRTNAERTVEIPDHAGTFVTAAANGATVMLSDGRIYGQLEGGAPVEEADITEGKGGLVEVIGQSEDLSFVYFVDTVKLSETPNAEGATAQEGQDNLYAWHSGVLTYLTTVLPGDNQAHTAEASPDGRWLAFYSAGKIDVYDAASGTLTCVSCSASKVPAQGASYLPAIRGQGTSPQPHYLSDSGRVLFDSRNVLSSSDTNAVEDVYEYEPAGVGACTRENGCVSLISAGTGMVDSNFLAMDPTGKNVFFTTRDQLTGSDRDQAIDVYDAREGGGITSESEAPAKECQGEECQGAPPIPQGEPAPGSLAFSGAGNLVSPLAAAPPSRPKSRTLTRAQKLAAALKACGKRPKSRRASCQRSARKKFGSKATAKKAANNRKRAK